MKPIIYEIKRSLTSKFVIIMIVAIVGLSALLAYESGSTFSPVSIPANTASIGMRKPSMAEVPEKTRDCNSLCVIGE